MEVQLKMFYTMNLGNLARLTQIENYCIDFDAVFTDVKETSWEIFEDTYF